MTMVYVLTCNDVIKSMERDDIKVTADTLDEAWDKAKTKFAQKYKTKKEYIDITGCRKEKLSMGNKYEVKFQYADSYSGYKWRNQSCIVYAPDEYAAREKCISLYGLADGDCEYKIISVEKKG